MGNLTAFSCATIKQALLMHCRQHDLSGQCSQHRPSQHLSSWCGCRWIPGSAAGELNRQFGARWGLKLDVGSCRQCSCCSRYPILSSPQQLQWELTNKWMAQAQMPGGSGLVPCPALPSPHLFHAAQPSYALLSLHFLRCFALPALPAL